MLLKNAFRAYLGIREEEERLIEVVGKGEVTGGSRQSEQAVNDFGQGCPAEEWLKDKRSGCQLRRNDYAKA